MIEVVFSKSWCRWNINNADSLLQHVSCEGDGPVCKEAALQRVLAYLSDRYPGTTFAKITEDIYQEKPPDKKPEERSSPRQALPRVPVSLPGNPPTVEVGDTWPESEEDWP